MQNLKFIFILILIGAAISSVSASELETKVIGKGEPMVLIPGLTCHGDVWLETVEKYKNNYECHILTLPGMAGVEPVEFGDSYVEKAKQLVLEYIQEKKLKKPILAGHSLGGFIALSIAVDQPDLPSKLLIIDSLPFLPGVQMPGATLESVKPIAENMRTMMANTTPEMWETNQKMILKTMITNEEDILVAAEWGSKSDRKTAAQAMYDLYTTDLRSGLNNVQSPILVLGAWIAFKDYGATADGTLKAYESQYENAENCTVKMTNIGKHFIMWDDPEFYFSELDKFLL